MKWFAIYDFDLNVCVGYEMGPFKTVCCEKVLGLCFCCLLLLYKGWGGGCYMIVFFVVILLVFHILMNDWLDYYDWGLRMKLLWFGLVCF